MDKERAGKVIRDARLCLGLTQCQLAALLNVKQATVATWELGTTFPKPKNMIKVCEILRIPVEKLLKAG